VKRKRKLHIHLFEGDYKTYRHVATLEVGELPPGLNMLLEVDGRLYRVTQIGDDEVLASDVHVFARYSTQQQLTM